MPRSTSIELTSIFDYEMNERKWIKTISHRYTSFDNNLENTTDTYIEDKNDFNQLIAEIQNYDLRDLKNNYYTDERPENFSRWELTYNNYFKIVWTQDNIVDELVKIMELLNIKKIIEEEINKVREKLLEINGQERQQMDLIELYEKIKNPLDAQK